MPRLSLLLRVGLLSALAALVGLAGCDRGSGLHQQGSQWLFDDMPFTPPDPAHFQVLSRHEARDTQAVYYVDTYRKGQEYWAIAHLAVTPIRGADPATYQVLAHGHARDRHRAYDRGEPFEVRDVASFEPLSARFARDAQRGYFEHLEIPDSHGPSFALADEHDAGHARDRSRVYFGDIEIDVPGRRPHPVVRTLRGADPATLRVLGRGYAADTRRVWYRGEPLDGADAASFMLSDEADADARDRSQRWQRGRRVAATPTPAASAASAASSSTLR